MEGGMCLNGVRRRSYCIESRILSRTRPVGALHRSLQQGQSPCPCPSVPVLCCMLVVSTFLSAHRPSCDESGDGYRHHHSSLTDFHLFERITIHRTMPSKPSRSSDTTDALCGLVPTLCLHTLVFTRAPSELPLREFPKEAAPCASHQI